MAKDRFDIKEKEGVSFMTDAVGKDLVQQLSEDSSFERVEIIESQEILKVQ